MVESEYFAQPFWLNQLRIEQINEPKIPVSCYSWNSVDQIMMLKRIPQKPDEIRIIQEESEAVQRNRRKESSGWSWFLPPPPDSWRRWSEFLLGASWPPVLSWAPTFATFRRRSHMPSSIRFHLLFHTVSKFLSNLFDCLQWLGWANKRAANWIVSRRIGPEFQTSSLPVTPPNKVCNNIRWNQFRLMRFGLTSLTRCLWFSGL